MQKIDSTECVVQYSSKIYDVEMYNVIFNKREFINGNYYLVFQKCFSTALRKRLSCPDSRASTSRYTCHMSMMFSFSERTSITLSPTARVWILNKFPPIFFGREKKFCQIFRMVKNDAKYASKFDKKNTFSSFWWLVAEYTHYMVMLSISFDSLDVFTS